MFNKIKVILLSLVLVLSACTTATTKGQCVGILDIKDPNLTYSLSKWNIFLGVLFSETIIIPGIVLFKELECPYESDTK